MRLHGVGTVVVRDGKAGAADALRTLDGRAWWALVGSVPGVRRRCEALRLRPKGARGLLLAKAGLGPLGGKWMAQGHFGKRGSPSAPRHGTLLSKPA